MKIRFIQQSDERQTKRLILRYLKETYAEGGDFPPTLENAQGFFDFAVKGAECGDPCLVAVDEQPVEGATTENASAVFPKIVGFVMALGVLFPGMQTRDITLRSWGTYVLPEHRGSRIAIKLFMVMGRIAKNKGYTRVLGMTHGTGYEDNAFKVVKSIVGMKEIGKVLMWQLSPPAAGKENPHVPPRPDGTDVAAAAVE